MLKKAKLMVAGLGLALAAALPLAASADTFKRANVPVDGGAFAYGVLINTGGSFVYLTNNRALAGRAPSTSFDVLVRDDIDIYSPAAVLAFLDEEFSPGYELQPRPYHRTVSRTVATPGDDGELGTADDGSEVIRVRRNADRRGLDNW